MLSHGNVCTIDIKLQKNKNAWPEKSWGELNSLLRIFSTAKLTIKTKKKTNQTNHTLF